MLTHRIRQKVIVLNKEHVNSSYYKKTHRIYAKTVKTHRIIVYMQIQFNFNSSFDFFIINKFNK